MSLAGVVGTRGIVVGLTAIALGVVILATAFRAHARVRRLARSLAAGGWSGSTLPSRVEEALAISSTIPLLLVLGRMIDAVERSRAMMLEAVTRVDHARELSLASVGLSQEIGAILGGMIGIVLPLLLGAVAAGVAISARSQRSGLARAVDLAGRDREAALAWAAHPGPCAASLIAVILGFIVLGLGPVIAGAIWGTSLQLQAFERVTGAEPAVKAPLYEQAQHVAGRILESGYRAAMIGVVCAAVGAAVLLWRTSPSRARVRLLGRPAPVSRRGGAVAGLTLAIAAIALFAFARPMKRENATPWPSGSANYRLHVETPALDGPDKLELGPLVVVTTTGLTFDVGGPGGAGVEAGLRAYRANFPVLHPGEPTPKEILLACAPNASGEHVLAAIEVARRTGYDSVRFVFERARAVVRPVIGNVILRDVTAARVSISADGASDQAVTEFVRPDGATTCAQLAARVVDLRRAGRPVRLLLPPAPLDRHQPPQE